MKINRKLLSAILVVCLILSSAISASAASLNATYYEASYYDIATTAYSRMLLFDDGNGVVAAANQNKQYGLITVTGEVVVPFQYKNLALLGGGLFNATNSEGKHGIIDSSGKVVWGFTAEEIMCYNSTLAITELGEDGKRETNYYTLSLTPATAADYSGRPAFAADYDHYWSAGSSRYYHVYKGSQRGLLDADGNTVFALGEYKSISVYQSGDGTMVFLVTDDEGQDALLDQNKNVIVAPGTYDAIEYDGHKGSGTLHVTKDGQKGAIDFVGKVLVPLGSYTEIYNENSQGYISAVNYEGSYRNWTNLSSTVYKDGQAVKTYPGKRVATEVYYRELLFSGTDFDRYGIMDVDGNVLIPAQYAYINPVSYYAADSDLIAWLPYGKTFRDTYYGLYRQDGTHIFEDKYTSISYLTDGKYRVNDGEHYGVLSAATADPAQQVVIPLKYDDLRVFTYNFLLGYDGDSYIILDSDNNVVVPASTEEARIFSMPGDFSRRNKLSLDSDLYWTDRCKEGMDGYTEDILPFVIQTASGPVTVYAGYESGTNYGQVDRPASNINGSGWFVYQDPSTGLYGFAHTDEAYWSNDGSTVKFPQIAYASTQTVLVDGAPVTFRTYALKDANGNMTNYIKLRDLAVLLNGSAAQFQVGWDGSVTITTRTTYTPNGSELSTPYSGDRTYQEATAATKVNGQSVNLAAFVLNDDQGGGYTYYQLRGLGQALGFNVGWAADKGIYLETDKPYDANN